MVDVSSKSVTWRQAVATGEIFLGSELVDLVRKNSLKKGDVIGVAQLAGILAAKKTSELIPLCHQLALSQVNVSIRLEGEIAVVECIAKCSGQTGVEMEALVGVSMACLAIYDMCKAVSREMVIGNIKLVTKIGGKSDYNIKSTP